MSTPKLFQWLTSSIFKDNKKESHYALMEKLEKRKENILKTPVSNENKDRDEELQILSLLIEKGNKQFK